MSAKLRIGLLGLTHDHIWDHLPALTASENAELVAAVDPNEPLLKRVANETGCRTYESLEQLADAEELDGVFVYSSNSEGAELATWAAQQGWHVVIEKPMAADLAGADAMVAAARQADVQLLVNWPFAWWPQLQKAIAMVSTGEIGDLWQVKYHAAHAGPQELGCSEYFCDWLFDVELNGGGAMMDYCCYGCILAQVLLGSPSRVTGIAGRFRKDSLLVEDNALIAMQYARAMATAEASWTQIGKLTSYTTAIYGSEGTLLVEPRAGGRLLLATAEHPEGEAVAVPAVPLHLQNPIEHLVHCVRTGEKPQPLCLDRNARDAQEILEAGRLSVLNDRAVSLPLPIV